MYMVPPVNGCSANGEGVPAELDAQRTDHDPLLVARLDVSGDVGFVR